MWIYRNEATGELVNSWLRDFDADADGGKGLVTVTDSRDEAMIFDSVQALHDVWTRQSQVLPLRADGKPNRPLTAYTMEARPIQRENGVRWGSNTTRGGS